MKKEIIRDCHFCEYACCTDEHSKVDCYVADGSYFDHHVEDSKTEAEYCTYFDFCDSFPKY